MRTKYQRVYAAVDLSAVRFNMERMHENLQPGTGMLGVIKADGYGHGAVPVARELVCGCDGAGGSCFAKRRA